MNTFAKAVRLQEARTQNDMKALQSTADACTDLFFKIGASRGKDITSSFVAAFVENSDYAVRIAQWVRDVRGGAGERQLFRDILSYLEKNEPELAMKLIAKIPELGRFDDMLIDYENKNVEAFAFRTYRDAIMAGNGLAAKWAPRKGYKAKQLREFFGMSPKQYRKTLVGLTDVVETKMCQKQWEAIEFSKIPSLAHSRYKTAFYRNAQEVYEGYVNALMKGDPSVKVNAGAVYPYDVLKGIFDYWGVCKLSQTEKNLAMKQWEALENFIGDANILPLVDVSGSMTCKVGGGNKLTCLDVAVSLGLYCAEKNTGKFQDMMLTFSASPQLVQLKGNILEKCLQMVKTDWGMNTNLHSALDKVLSTAINAGVPQSEMPDMLIVFSDMQFDRCCRFDDSAMEMITRKYEAAGYQVPKLVFWNLNAYDNVPVKFDTSGVALVSGFSPNVMKSLLSGELEKFTPEAIMLETIMIDRYRLD